LVHRLAHHLVPGIAFTVLSIVTGSQAISYLASIVSLGLGIWFAVQLGTTGATPGMRVTGLSCVDASTGGHVGPGRAIGRWILEEIFLLACFLPGAINYLSPLWDKKNQMITDKMVRAAVVVAPRQPFSLVPPAK
jgi:uncharacterized RDD family membrane protein YckC